MVPGLGAGAVNFFKSKIEFSVQQLNPLDPLDPAADLGWMDGSKDLGVVLWIERKSLNPLDP